MSNQNRFLLPHAAASSSSISATPTTSNKGDNSSNNNASSQLDPFDQENQLSVDTDFDSYWEEEARNPHRNRIRIGRQYQATVPALLKSGEKDQRKLEDLETLSFCPKKSAKVSDAELDHYFTVAKSLNLFASLVETRSLLGRDVTIADLNHIRHKEGLSLASVIQPSRQQTSCTSNSIVSPSSSQQASNSQQTIQSGQQQPLKSPPTNSDKLSTSSSSSPKENTNSENCVFNQPLMRALSHFISLHHPCHHDGDCKKLLRDIPLEDESGPAVSITAGNLRQSFSSTPKESKSSRSRSSLKQVSSNSIREEPDRDQDDHQASNDSTKSPSYADWTREEVELFSKAIEICGKNFSAIKKEFLPSKSVKSIVEYYYIGSRDAAETKKKSNQFSEPNDKCSSPEKSTANNNGQGNGGGSSGPTSGGKGGHNSNIAGTSNSNSSSNRTTNSSNETKDPSQSISDSGVDTKTSNSGATPVKTTASPKTTKTEQLNSNGLKVAPKNLDARMSVYNFDEEFKDDSPLRLDLPRPGAEVKPLKAKPIIPNAVETDPTNSNVGSLKFFMDGQLVLKLNACQEQQAGIEKCHWVQSGEKSSNTTRQKRYTKRADKSSSEYNQNGSQSGSVISSYQDDDSKNDDISCDEDSKESMNSFTNLPQHRSNQGSPNSKRLKIKAESNNQQVQLPSPIDYNRLAVNNRIKERNDNLNPSPMLNQAAMPWLQANSIAMAAALLNGMSFTPTSGNMMENAMQGNVNPGNMASKPMDLSLEHISPKSIQKSTSRSRSRPKNN